MRPALARPTGTGRAGVVSGLQTSLGDSVAVRTTAREQLLDRPPIDLPVQHSFSMGSPAMLQMMMGGRVYESGEFKNAMDSNYYPLENMQQSVEKLTNSQNIDIATMEFGQYQPILAPAEINPNGPKAWLKHVGFARVHLTDMPNTTPLSRDEPDVVPLTKCALLDASVRKCFNSTPGRSACSENVIQKGQELRGSGAS